MHQYRSTSVDRKLLPSDPEVKPPPQISQVLLDTDTGGAQRRELQLTNSASSPVLIVITAIDVQSACRIAVLSS